VSFKVSNVLITISLKKNVLIIIIFQLYHMINITCITFKLASSTLY